jgi:hypothetical protein
MRSIIFYTLLLSGSFAAVTPARAAEDDHSAKVTGDAQDSWTYQPPTNNVVTARMIVQQKAEIRAQQRMDRLAALSWYGMSNSRPMASGTPYCSMYSPTWQVPGGRPFAWYSNGRPTYLFR